MLNWLYKKFTPARTPAAAAAKSPLPAAPKPAARPEVDWAGRLHAAQGDDAALLNVALSADVLAIKLEAVQALVSEEALKQAERQFRNHDRKVHRLCKQRWAAAVAQREARATAQALLARTHTLLAEPVVPANHLVTLDRDWAALPQPLLEPQQSAEFAALRAELDTLMRERTEAQRQQLRQSQQWTADAQQWLQAWVPEALAAAEHGQASDLGPVQAALATLRATRPEAGVAPELDQALAQALHTITLVQARLTWLETPLPAASVTPDTEAHTADAIPADASPPAAPETQTQPRWETLPALPDSALAQVLNQRYTRWALARQPAKAAKASPAPAPAKPPRAPSGAPLSEALREQLGALAQQAEVALVDGHVSESQRHLQALERALAAEPTAVLPDDLHARRQALRAEHARLKDWQQWGGQRARDELVAQAEALAAQTPRAAEAQPDAGAEIQPETTTPKAPKLNLKAHADAIRQLRQQWKALDRTGGPAGTPQWQRFDAALQTAYLPVAAQQALVQAARLENQASREALLGVLEALPLPDPADPTPASGAWRELLRELDRFQHAWRQLGPIEHTVPADAREALLQRWRQTVGRIEQPLDEVRRVAAANRETLIAQAESLATAPSGHQGALPETLRRVRELQAAWQDAARQMPLARAVEVALWTRFKAATDAVYAQREAAFAEREAEQAAHIAAREALLARLAGMADDAPQAELARALAEVEAQWRQAADVPRAASEALDARLTEARTHIRQRLAAASRQRLQAQCDSLVTRLALCVAREDGDADAGGDAAAERWAACNALPRAWEQALTQRWTEPVAAGPLSSDESDALLLQLETAWDLPSPPEWQDARRQLKLQGLKHALEGRGPAPQDKSAGNPDQALVLLLRQGRLSAKQRERLLSLTTVLPSVLERQSMARLNQRLA